jgi:hemoglobin/transferrin/lactoferrin receptor protein
MHSLVRVLAFSVLLLAPAAAAASDLQGFVKDRVGGVLPGAVVRLINIASSEERTTKTDAAGRYRFEGLTPGTYRVAAAHPGFSESSRTLVLTDAQPAITADFTLDIGSRSFPVDVTAMRGARDPDVIPLRTDLLPRATLERLAPVGTGDALIAAPAVTPVGSGPFQTRPRLRGLDSTRVLVLIDGERLNNARTATDRAGVEVGLVNIDAVQDIEVLGGAGSVLYGTDALSGTINIITNRPRYSTARQFAIGFDGYYSSNEDGRRGTVTLGVSDRRWAVSFAGGAERFDDFRAGGNFAESSAPFFADGTLTATDTVDTNFGFNFRAFPEPFNAPFTRTSRVVPRSGAEGSSFNLAATALVTPSQELQVRYLRRHASDVGFPDFEPPFFFQTITLPWSNLDKISAAYSFLDVTPRLKKVTASAYYQRQDRLLRNEFPVQFPAPTAVTFFPISIFRLNIESDTRQQVWTPGFDLQANIQLLPSNVLTAGLTVFRDRSEDERTTVTQTTMIGNVALGPRGPAATVFPAPVVLGPPVTDHPVRVPNASFRDLGFFAQDEWAISPVVRLSGGLRVDNYAVKTEATPGYDIDRFTAGAVPPIDPNTLPSLNGDDINRAAITGEAGVVVSAWRPVSLFAHYVHSYRHANLEELLFSGTATAGNIVPNITVEPETGNNVDVGAKVRTGRISTSLAYFHNRYANFISTEVVASSPAGTISQAINLAAVRIHGIEAQGDTEFVAGGLTWSPHASAAWTHGTVLSGTSPLTGVSLAGEPQDNISPFKFVGGLRVGDRSDRWWAAYGLRAQAKVTRISPLLSESPFLIAQDLLSLDGFAVHRLAFGYNWRTGGQRLGLTLSVDNLGDRFYREHFQFAPARGRSMTLTVRVRGVK